MGRQRWQQHGGRQLALLLLALGTASLLPGLIVQQPRPGTAESALAALPERSRGFALLELECDEGVFTDSCLQGLEQLTRALELDARVAEPVRSLARAPQVSVDSDGLVLSRLAAGARREADVRRLRARVRDDAALAARFVRPDARATWLYAPLAPGVSAERAQRLAEALRARFERPPLRRVEAWIEAEPAAGGWPDALRCGLGLLTLLGVAALLGPRLAALVALCALGGALWLRAFGSAVPALSSAGAASLSSAGAAALASAAAAALAGAACAALALPLLLRTRAELRRGVALGDARAQALAWAAPPALIAAAAVGPSAGLSPALACVLLASGLVAVLLACLLAPLLGGAARSTPLDLRVERGLARLDAATRAHPRAIALLALALAVAAGAGLVTQRDVSTAPRLERLWVDAGSAGGALEPEFLERVEALQRELAARPAVASASSLVDAVLAPAQRALHDGDAVFGGVPPVRVEVERTLARFAAHAPQELADRIDAARRRVAIDVRVGAAPASASGGWSRLGFALLLLAGLCALWLRSPAAGAASALPALLGAAVAWGSGAPLELALLAASATGVCALLLVARADELARAGAERSVALSLALRDAGRPSLLLALTGAGAALLAGSVQAAVTALLAAPLALSLAPLCARALGIPNTPASLRAEVSGRVGSIHRRGRNAR